MEAEYPVHDAVYLVVDLLASSSLVHKAIEFPVCT